MKPACYIKEITLSVVRYDHCQVTNKSRECIKQTRHITHTGLDSVKCNILLQKFVFLNPDSGLFLGICMNYSNTGFFHCWSFSLLQTQNQNERDFFCSIIWNKLNRLGIIKPRNQSVGWYGCTTALYTNAKVSWLRQIDIFLPQLQCQQRVLMLSLNILERAFALHAASRSQCNATGTTTYSL